jgi:branched-chain amino acid transport system ATP-binding protein
MRDMTGETLLSVRNLSTGYGAIQVLWDVNLDIREGEIVCVVGANGAGKSTLLNTLLGMVPAWSGSISFAGTDITGLSGPKRVAMGMGFAPEGRHLFYGLSVEDNLLMGAYQRPNDSSVREDLDYVYSVFEAVSSHRNRLAGNLSGGEQQMCAIGCALMARPKLLVIDELSLGLAPVIVDDLIRIISALRRERGIGILLVEQDVQVALDLSDRGYVVESGRVTLEDTSENLGCNGHVKAAYLGIA